MCLVEARRADILLTAYQPCLKRVRNWKNLCQLHNAVMSVALAAFYDLDFPQYQIPPMPDSTIFIFGEEKIIYTTRHTFRSCIYTSPSPYREFQNAVFMGFLSILCKSFTLTLTIFYKTIHEFIFM